MSKGYFVRITKIDKIPSPNLSNYVEVTGEALIIDSLGAEVTVCFYDVSSNNAGLAWPLGVKGGGDFQLVVSDEYEDGEANVEGEYVLTIDDYAEVERDLVAAVENIDREASLAAEDAWMQVWVDAAVAAENV